VPKRQILDNISIAYLVKEWAEENNKPILFLKLNFEKAFDRVDFNYLWQTIELMRLGGKFLQLVKGLVIGAKAKIIVNGLYADSISIKRGVRQGDSLAFLLFAILTHPLISYIDYQIESHRLPILLISKELTICHMLFADDVRIFILALETAFEELRKCIALYEKALGAKLNLQKLIITPIALDNIPDRIYDIGCSILANGDITKHLGAPFSNNLSSAAMQNFYLDKLAKRIVALKPRSISFLG
jgi:hypothetical protein